MRSSSGLVCAAVLIAAFGATAALAQGETQATPAPPTASLNSMPHWSEFPVPPTDVPTAAEIKTRVDIQLALRDQLRAQFNALQWDAFEPDTLAAAIHAQVDSNMLTPVDAPLSKDQLAGMGAALRAKAAPPPVAD